MKTLLWIGAVLGAHVASAGEVTSYFKSSADQTPRGDAGFWLTSDGVKLNADLALRAPDGSTLLQPRLSSTVALGDRLGLQTQLRLDDWNSHAEIPGTNVADTSLRYRSSVPFFDDLEGRVWRAPDGRSGETLGMEFHRRFVSGDPTPITLSGKASVESTVAPLETDNDQPVIEPGAQIGTEIAAVPSVVFAETRRVRFETELRGLLPQARGRSVLSFKVDQATGATRATASSIAYRYSWKIGGGDLGFNFKLRRTIDTEMDVFDRSLGVNWKWQL